jgi:hypothetical protein
MKTHKLAAVGNIDRYFSLEAWIWIFGLCAVASMDPNSDRHFTIFLPDLLFGIKSPGYGLGHSVSFLFRGDVIQAFQSHYLGPFAVLIILHRIYQLFFKRPHTYVCKDN